MAKLKPEFDGRLPQRISIVARRLEIRDHPNSRAVGLPSRRLRGRFVPDVAQRHHYFGALALSLGGANPRLHNCILCRIADPRRGEVLVAPFLQPRKVAEPAPDSLHISL